MPNNSFLTITFYEESLSLMSLWSQKSLTVIIREWLRTFKTIQLKIIVYWESRIIQNLPKVNGVTVYFVLIFLTRNTRNTRNFTKFHEKDFYVIFRVFREI
jgi:hypothetical protein